MRLRARKGSRASLVWATDTSPGLHDLPFPLRDDGHFHTYNLETGGASAWTGTLVALGIRPSHTVGDQVVLSGAASKVDLKRLEVVSANYKQIVNLVREEEVTLKKMVYIKVQFMEFRRNALENLGVQWGTSMNGPAAAITGEEKPLNENKLMKPSAVSSAPTSRNGARPTRLLTRSDQAPISGSHRITHSFGPSTTKPDSQAGTPSMVVRKTGSRTAGVSRKTCAPVWPTP